MKRGAIGSGSAARRGRPLRLVRVGSPPARLAAVALALPAALSALACSAAGDAPPNAPAPETIEAELRAVVRDHFAAIEARDLDALLETVTAGGRLTLILPDGAHFETRADYVALHRDWFAQDGWTLAHEVLEVRPGKSLGLVLVRTTMLDDTPRSGRQAFLTLVFARAGDRWRLVFDQNTAIPMPAGDPEG